MEINYVRIYKYQYLIDIAASITWSTDDQPSDHLRSIHFLDPHGSHVFTSPVSPDSPYFIDYKYGLSKHPHNRAVEMLIKDPKLVDLSGIIRNPNPKIAPLLEQYLEQFHFVHWRIMCQSNHKVILEFLEKHIDKIDESDWGQLSGNDHEIAIRILQNNPHRINFCILSGNPSGFEIMKQHMGLINWWYFTGNTHPDAIRIIEQNLDHIPTVIVSTDTYWMVHPNYRYHTSLSQNPNAFHILLENPRFIHFDSLLLNPSPRALAYIEANATQINDSNIAYLVKNPNGLSLIEKLLKHGQLSEDVVMRCYFAFVTNPAFFDLDYKRMSKERSKIIYNELTEKAFHPSRVSKWLDYHCENGGTIEDFEM